MVPESVDPSHSARRSRPSCRSPSGVFVMAGWTLDMDQLDERRAGLAAHVAAHRSLFHARRRGVVADRARATQHAIGRRLLAAIGVLILRATSSTGTYTSNSSHWDRYRLGSRAASGRRAWRPPPPGSHLFGLSLIFSLPRRTALLHQAIAIAALLVGWLGMSRYVFGGEALFAVADMSIQAATLICLLRAGALTLRTDAGIAAAGQRWRRRRHGAPPVASGDHRAAGRRRAHDPLRASRHLQLRGRGRSVRAGQHDRVRGIRVDQRGTRRACRSSAARRRARAARSEELQLFRDRARRHRHDRRTGKVTGWSNAGGSCSAGRAATRWDASSRS